MDKEQDKEQDKEKDNGTNVACSWAVQPARDHVGSPERRTGGTERAPGSRGSDRIGYAPRVVEAACIELVQKQFRTTAHLHHGACHLGGAARGVTGPRSSAWLSRGRARRLW